jgi:hypothetical protein
VGSGEPAIAEVSNGGRGGEPTEGLRVGAGNIEVGHLDDVQEDIVSKLRIPYGRELCGGTGRLRYDEPTYRFGVTGIITLQGARRRTGQEQQQAHHHGVVSSPRQES